MSELEYFKMIGEYGEYRPAGEVSLHGMVEMVTSALVFARKQQVGKLLVITTGLTGFPPPHIADRYFFVKDWALAARQVVRASFVALPEMIHPRKFGVRVAENHGFAADVFESEEEALAWLLQHTK